MVNVLALLLAPLFSVSDIRVAENGGSATVTVTKSAPAKSWSRVNLTTADGSAKAGSDYSSVSTPLTFGNNELVKSVLVPILDDKLVEGDEAFSVQIAGVRYATISKGTGTVTVVDDDAQPASSVGGEAQIDDNFDVSAWLEPGEAPHVSPDAVGAFRFTCAAGQLAKDDPIVFPGQPGKSHLHQFFGNTSTDAYSNYQTLRTTGGSTCTKSTDISPQRTAYWMPAMLDGAGNAVKPDWMNTYYKQLPASDPNCTTTVDPVTLAPGPATGKCVPIPNGIRFILGYNMATGTGGPNDSNSRDWWAMGFDCVSKASNGGTSYTGIKHTIADIVATGKCPSGEWLRVFLAFPQCWDGKNVDSADHRAHIVMPPQSICPTDHPYRVPEVAISAFFTTDANFLAGKWHLSSDEMMPNLPAGSTLHMDYWEAWSPVIKALWQANCIDGHLSCSNGNVGDGRQVKGMAADHSDHVLVPLQP